MQKILFLVTFAVLWIFSQQPSLAANPYASVQQKGPVTPTHCASWVGPNQIQDTGSTCGSGTPNVSNATGTLPVANGGFPIPPTSITQANASSALATILNQNTAILLPHWRSVLAQVRAGKANARVFAIGDSTTYGYGAVGASTGNDVAQSYPKFLSDLFNNHGINSNWNGIFGDGRTAGINDSRFTLGTGWMQSGQSSGNANYVFGGGTLANLPSFGGGVGNLSFTPTVPVDTFKVWFFKSTSSPVGNFNINIDGGTPVTLSSSGSNLYGSGTITAALGIHTLNVVSNDTVNIWIQGIEAYNSAQSSVNIINCGAGSSTSVDWNRSANFYSAINAIQTFSPDLTIINLGINDWNGGTSLSTYSTNITALITAAKAGGGDVVIASPNPTNSTASQATQLTYINTLYTIAAANNVPIVDNFDRWVSYTVSNGQGYYFDVFHPLAIGYADLAQGIFNVIGEP